ncbi:uncharacterized protein CTHT_0001040 [Thermochaetoides thermophila DSM 1495]|uniref:Uncharacterized protein n=1 Tax=Chaetomium thermophilum (strain DSM 1495 / CBS 144.50 / IMI 039719) TaxID=759272 RepID=G0RYY7_CHATD|nr:hypothetical protein CTHT_0001040 [Thermochaetoides thermophila DSM 1495]EGS23415.1 hypothetical protein CTHT_0001040 [Thermochaetoides thermophila DSM 1495]
MLSAGKMQHRCPGCRAQLLTFYDVLLPRSTRASAQPLLHRRLHTPHSTTPRALPSVAARSWRSNSLRAFSTTHPVRQEPVQESSSTADVPATTRTQEEIETFVRHARQTFGLTLPADYLTPEEYKVYERLYGPPLRETTPEDVGIPARTANAQKPDGSVQKPFLLRDVAGGLAEEVPYAVSVDPNVAIEAAREAARQAAAEEGVEMSEEEMDAEIKSMLEEGLLSLPGTSEPVHVDWIQATANNEREYEALVKLQRDFEEAARRARTMPPPAEDTHEEESIIEEDEPREEEEIDEDESDPDAVFFPEDGHIDSRLHPYTSLGKFRTFPSTIHIPKATFVEPISELLKRTDTVHIRECAERVFGGPGLPYSPMTPKSKSNLPQKPVQLEAGFHRMSAIEADTYLATVLPPVYASIMSVLVEVRKRLGSKWLRDMLLRKDGPRILDAGAGGAGLLAWEDVLRAEWEVLREEGKVSPRRYGPPGKKTVVIGNENLRHRVSRFLDNTTFLPRLPDYLHSVMRAQEELDSGGKPQPHKVFDIIIVSHMLMPIDKEHKRREFIDNLWTMLEPKGGVLIVLEKGHPRGFEAVASVRDQLLDKYILPPHQHPREADFIPNGDESESRPREPGMIIAPCTHHHKCPMYLTPGLSQGRKDFCHFTQRYLRPPFLQKVLGATHKSHDDIEFSYLAIRRGVRDIQGETLAPSGAVLLTGQEANNRAFVGYGNGREQSEKEETTVPHPLSLPRNILPPIKKKGHVTLDLCTPAGTLERWVVPRSFSKQAYHDARKAAWGDLWALGAKTRTIRTARVGRGVVEGERKGKNKQEPQRKNPRTVHVNVHPKLGVLGARFASDGSDATGAVEDYIDKKGGKKKLVKMRIEEVMERLGEAGYEDAGVVDAEEVRREFREELRREMGEDDDADLRELEEAARRLNIDKKE